MRFGIKGFDNYEVDEKGQVFSKTREVRFGKSIRIVKGQMIKPTESGVYVLYNGIRYRLTSEQIWERRIEK